MKLLTVIGARPQFIKAASVSHVLQREGFDEILLHTGQHFDDRMSQIFFDELKIPKPKHQLSINSLTHGAMTGRMLEQIEAVLLQEKPQAVLVYGDTNSTLAGALAAAKLNIPVAHVEAGLRSFNRRMPEELNRIMTDHLSALLFTPTEGAIANLRKEGIDSRLIHNVGDVMLDSTRLFRPIAEKRADMALNSDRFALLTFHRQENTDDEQRLKAILSAVNEVAEKIAVVFPVHPRTRKIMSGFNISLHANVHQIEPVGYLEMLQLESKAAVVITDSGGVQKEAYFNGVPCVTIRTETEWVELVDSGWNTLANPADAPAIVKAVTSSLGSKGKDVQLYGDGRAAEKIATALKSL